MKDSTHVHGREQSMNDDDLNRLSKARERVVPEHHHHSTLAREIESWWGVTNGDEMVDRYGAEAVQLAHEKMQGFTPEQLDLVRNLGGYFRKLVAQSVPADGAQLLGRTAPHMKRKRDAEIAQSDGEARSLERRAVAAEIPGTLEHRIKYGGKT